MTMGGEATRIPTLDPVMARLRRPERATVSGDWRLSPATAAVRLAQSSGAGLPSV